MAGLWPAGWTAAAAGRAPRLQPLVLTAALPPALQRAADKVRQKHYPEGARAAPAHLGLFRHLPGPAFESLLYDLQALAAGALPPELRLGAPRWKNDLLAAPVASPALDALRFDLARRWQGLLAPGDLAPPLLHITLARGRRQPDAGSAALPPGPWRTQGLLLWAPGGYGEAFWRPLVACCFRR